MKQLVLACDAIFSQIIDTLEQITDKDFTTPSPALGHVTIGQHLRHTLEFFICLQQGFEKGCVNYDKRKHDRAIETDKSLALKTISKIREFINEQTTDASLKLEVGYNTHHDECITIESNFYRELAYNIEHMVHHMAIIKIGIREVAGYVVLPPNFGVAVSTIRYQEKEMATH
jgi:uncharacterized damage-inducible protein DinB